jgi:hypothetical protein
MVVLISVVMAAETSTTIPMWERAQPAMMIPGSGFAVNTIRPV